MGLEAQKLQDIEGQYTTLVNMSATVNSILVFTKRSVPRIN